jgi:NADP-dependent 3-hydroxy acid dehydrogenase YdfG
MIKSDQNVVLITGASRGIGCAAALALASAGVDLVLWARTETDLKETADACRERGVNARTCVVDVSDPEMVADAGARSLAGLGALRGVVVNAGVGIWNALGDVSVDEWRALQGTNLDGAFHTLKAAIPLLLRHRAPQLIAVASDSSEYSFENRAAYCASKWGMLGFIEAIRREVRSKGVRVTVLELSRVDTFFRSKQQGSRPNSLSADEVAQLISMIFLLPARVEIRELKASAITSTWGPYPEVWEPELAG